MKWSKKLLFFIVWFVITISLLSNLFLSLIHCCIFIWLLHLFPLKLLSLPFFSYLLLSTSPTLQLSYFLSFSWSLSLFPLFYRNIFLFFRIFSLTNPRSCFCHLTSFFFFWMTSPIYLFYYFSFFTFYNSILFLITYLLLHFSLLCYVTIQGMDDQDLEITTIFLPIHSLLHHPHHCIQYQDVVK